MVAQTQTKGHNFSFLDAQYVSIIIKRRLIPERLNQRYGTNEHLKSSNVATRQSRSRLEWYFPMCPEHFAKTRDVRTKGGGRPIKLLTSTHGLDVSNSEMLRGEWKKQWTVGHPANSPVLLTEKKLEVAATRRGIETLHNIMRIKAQREKISDRAR